MKAETNKRESIVKKVKTTHEEVLRRLDEFGHCLQIDKTKPITK